MTKKLLLVAIAALLGICQVRAQDKNADLAIIVGKSSTLENVTTAELVRIMRAEKAKGPDGVKFVLSAREPGSPERNAILSQVYQMTEAEYTKFFLLTTFTGTVTAAPRQIASNGVTKQFVSGTPGGIGYLRGSETDDTVKVLKVDGKLPGEEGYPLKIK